MDVENFVSDDRATASLVVQSDAGKFVELRCTVDALCRFSEHLNLRFEALLQADGDGFCDCLPLPPLHLPGEDAATWRRLLVELEDVPLRKVAGSVGALPLSFPTLRVLCFCAPSAVDARLIIGNESTGDWEFLCSAEALCYESAYFEAAFRRYTWRESCNKRIRIENDDIYLWHRVLLQIHSHETPQLELAGGSAAGGEGEQLADAVASLMFCRKYVVHRLEQQDVKKLKDRPRLAIDCYEADSAFFRELAAALETLGVLKSLLSCWILGSGAGMAAAVACLLEGGGQLAKAVVQIPSVLSAFRNPEFLKTVGASRLLRPGGALFYLVEHGHLESLLSIEDWSWLEGPADVEQLVGEELFMPFLQLPGLRKELRQARFRSAALVAILTPFPMLFDDLLDSWFGEQKATENRSHSFEDPVEEATVDLVAAAAQTQRFDLPARELAEWSTCERFRRNGILRTQLETADVGELCSFVRSAPVEQPEVVAALRHQVDVVVRGAWSMLPLLPHALCRMLLDKAATSTLFEHGALTVLTYCRMVCAPLLAGPLIVPLRVLAMASTFRLLRASSSRSSIVCIVRECLAKFMSDTRGDLLLAGRTLMMYPFLVQLVLRRGLRHAAEVFKRRATAVSKTPLADQTQGRQAS
eukprot:TRINITY_DN102669_c0_g1_i1.p1 TRINITY_DN102669_c0_g1~~TRINITY_DN102669_c0_g1_i1.p1  ORF type:complete len:643 (-),score=106.37 TRINITY_DN102669_c0_g1_i1:188-2116(-)